METDIHLKFLTDQNKKLNQFASGNAGIKIRACGFTGATDIPNALIIEIRCRSAAMEDGRVIIADREHVLGFAIPPDYQRKAYDSMRLLTLLHPHNLFQPNILGHTICIGAIAPSTPFIEVLTRCYEVITCQRITMREEDALNKDACQWARHAKLPLQSGGLTSGTTRPLQSVGFLLEAEKVK